MNTEIDSAADHLNYRNSLTPAVSDVNFGGWLSGSSKYLTNLSHWLCGPQAACPAPFPLSVGKKTLWDSCTPWDRVLWELSCLLWETILWGFSVWMCSLSHHSENVSAFTSYRELGTSEGSQVKPIIFVLLNKSQNSFHQHGRNTVLYSINPSFSLCKVQ